MHKAKGVKEISGQKRINRKREKRNKGKKKGKTRNQKENFVSCLHRVGERTGWKRGKNGGTGTSAVTKQRKKGRPATSRPVKGVGSSGMNKTQKQRGENFPWWEMWGRGGTVVGRKKGPAGTYLW